MQPSAALCCFSRQLHVSGRNNSPLHAEKTLSVVLPHGKRLLLLKAPGAAWHSVGWWWWWRRRRVCRSEESLTQMPSILFETGPLTSLKLTQESRLVSQ